MAKFKIFTDSCSDLSTELRKEHDIEYVHMGLVVDGEEKIADLDWKEYSPEELYGWLSSGKKCKTTQVTVPEFINSFKPWLEQGYDIIYIGCSSALTGSLNTLETLAKPQLLEEFPERKIVTVDSLLACGCEAMLTLKAAELRDQGKTLEEVVSWCETNKYCYNQFCTVDTLNYLKAAGRIKGAKAFFGNIMGVKPIFISDRHGNNLVIKKAKGTKQSINEVFLGIKETIDKEKCDRVYVGQGMAQANAEILKKKIEDELQVPVTIFWIGPIIGVTCGPGVLAAFCFGKEVTRYEGDGK